MYIKASADVKILNCLGENDEAVDHEMDLKQYRQITNWEYAIYCPPFE